MELYNIYKKTLDYFIVKNKYGDVIKINEKKIKKYRTTSGEIFLKYNKKKYKFSYKKIKTFIFYKNINYSIKNKSFEYGTVLNNFPNIYVKIFGKIYNLKTINTYPKIDNKLIIGKRILVKINKKKNKIQISRKEFIDKYIEDNKKKIINLKKNKKIKGKVKEINYAGAFINLGGITGLVNTLDKNINKIKEKKYYYFYILYNDNKGMILLTTSKPTA